MWLKRKQHIRYVVFPEQTFQSIQYCRRVNQIFIIILYTLLSVITNQTMFFSQIDYIRRRQHISTIETGCSPTRGLLSSTSSNTPPLQSYTRNLSSGPSSVIGNMTLHSTHNAIGYCTLRNGSQNPTSIGSLTMVSFSFSTFEQ